MVRCFNCQRKISLAEELCPYCGCRAFSGEAVDEFAVGGGKLLRYNGSKKDVTLPQGIRIVGEMAFESTAVRSVILPEGVSTVEKAAFYDCHSLNYVEFPSSLRRIGCLAFAECPYLTSVTVPAACRIAQNAFAPTVMVIRG